MPPKKRLLFGKFDKAKPLKRKRQQETEEQKNLQRETNARRMAASREAEDEDQTNLKRSINASRMAASREAEDEDQTNLRRSINASRMAASREAEDEEQRNFRRNDARRTAVIREAEDEEQRNFRRSTNASRMAASREAEDEERRNLRRSRNASRMAANREAEDEEQRNLRRSTNASRMTARREAEDEDQRNSRLENNQHRMAEIRNQESRYQRITRLRANQQRMIAHRNQETQEEAENHRFIDRVKHAEVRARPFNAEQWRLGAFAYNPRHRYETEEIVQIGLMSKQCNHCHALKWKHEPPGLCCSGGKIRLPFLAEPPEPLKKLLDGTSPQSKHFLERIQLYNHAFQMTSFGAKYVNEGGFMPTFKIQGQIYHRIGSILPLHDDNHKFLQVYFISNMKKQAETRCNYNQRG